MTIRNPKIFGLEVERHLSDVKNPTAALTALGINPRDLEVIFDSTNTDPVTGTRVDFDDWRSFSRLSEPIYKSVDRFYSDSGSYTGTLDRRAGIDSLLFGNLNVNGVVSGNAIRYRYVNGRGNSATKGIADISTSRVSAWSSTVPEPIPSTAPISYGSKIAILASASGKSHLKFGTQATSTQPRLQTTLVPQKTEFDSEIPTSKIKVRIGTEDMWLYAMKGIPVTFRGIFKDLIGANVNVASIEKSPNNFILPSWTIVRTDNPNDKISYSNQNSLNFYSARARERFINIYYPSDAITGLTLNSAYIEGLPPVKFPTMTSLELQSNRLKTFPDFTTVTENLVSLNLWNNPFDVSEIVAERKFNQAIANKLPTSLTTLVMGRTFNGTIRGSGNNPWTGSGDHPSDILADRLPNLISLNLYRNAGKYFYPDNNDKDDGSNIQCTIPNLGEKVTSVNLQSNDFRRFARTDSANKRYNIKDLPNLESLNLYGNYNLSDLYWTGSAWAATGLESGLVSTAINTIQVGNTNLPMINCSGQANLTNYSHYNMRVDRSFFTNESGGTYTGYKFANCLKLEELYLHHANVIGPFPKFNHPELVKIDLHYTNISGLGPNASLDADKNFVIPKDTFQGCSKLQTFYIWNSNLNNEKPIHPDVFDNTPALVNFRLRSGNRVTGSLPNFANVPSLHWLDLANNAFTGQIPSFSQNGNIGYIYLHDNKLDGNIPAFKNLSSLDYLYLHNNKKSGSTGFTILNEFENLPNLRRFYCHNNSISGAIPNFSKDSTYPCPRLEELILMNNKFTAYTPESFKNLYYIRYIDISDNNLGPGAINQIIQDLFDNYEAVPRGSVTINLYRNYALKDGNPISTAYTPTGDALEQIQFLQSKNWTIQYKR